ncbi:MAG: type II toxin-antitoxin system VapC family toxin [Nitrososphaerales archaeon]|nr:type II toxin-antitoxin system VapC family toxin [Nitrososphaerales archaeon]
MEKKNEWVVDSSIVAKWFLNEPGSELAIWVRDEFATGRMKLAVPTLLFYEVVNALRFSGQFGETDLTLASRSLSKYQFEVWRPRGRLLELSAQISLSRDVTVYDACYVALTRRLGSKLITEDKELLGKFPTLTIPVGRFKVPS